MAAPVLDPPSVRPSTPRTLTLWCFRLLGLLQATLLVLQPISMGSFLQGSYESFGVHSIVGGLLVPMTMLTGLVGLALGVLARRPSVAVASIALAALTTVQVGLGHTRMLAVHVPLGVLLVATGLWLCAWSWTRGARWA